MKSYEALLAHLQQNEYRFTTVTPLTHERILKRRGCEVAHSLREAFGWNLPFEEHLLPADLLQMLKHAGGITEMGGRYRSNVRVSTIDDQYFLHSSFPTHQEDSVFFGPDTYRFVRFMKERLRTNPLRKGGRVLDIGCGSGAGGWMVARFSSDIHLVLNDINPTALEFAKINVRANRNNGPIETKADFALGDGLAAVPGTFDLIIANPPFLVDPQSRTYRHGGEKLGRALALKMLEQSLARLNPGGRILLYTGVAIVGGKDEFEADLKTLLNSEPHSKSSPSNGAKDEFRWNYKNDFRWNYEEIDPDIFGEELEQSAYAFTDRIAAVGLEVSRRR